MKKIAKLLIQTRASPSDPSFNDMNISGKSFYDYFHEKGIKILEKDLVVSCHGNTKLNLDIVNDIYMLEQAGHKVVSIQIGGLYFAKPGLDAANA